MAHLNGISENKFRNLAKTAVANFWNNNQKLADKYGYVQPEDVYVVWQCKCIQNLKALLGVPFEGDGYYFEFTWNGDSCEGYLDVYKKEEHHNVYPPDWWREKIEVTRK